MWPRSCATVSFNAWPGRRRSRDLAKRTGVEPRRLPVEGDADPTCPWLQFVALPARAGGRLCHVFGLHTLTLPVQLVFTGAGVYRQHAALPNRYRARFRALRGRAGARRRSAGPPSRAARSSSRFRSPPRCMPEQGRAARRSRRASCDLACGCDPFVAGTGPARRGGSRAAVP